MLRPDHGHTAESDPRRHASHDGMSSEVLALNARHGPHRRLRPKHALERRRICHTRDRASAQVRPTDYDARAGRSTFLQVDPVEGGSANDYDYALGDPVDNFDLDGLQVDCRRRRCSHRGPSRRIKAHGRVCGGKRCTYRNPDHHAERIMLSVCVYLCVSVSNRASGASFAGGVWPGSKGGPVRRGFGVSVYGYRGGNASGGVAGYSCKAMCAGAYGGPKGRGIIFGLGSPGFSFGPA